MIMDSRQYLIEKVMVKFSNGLNAFGYEIVDVAGFLAEIESGVPHIKMRSMKHDDPRFYEDIVAQSVETGVYMPARKVMKLCHKYGKPVDNDVIDKRLAEMDWKTKPRFNNALARNNLKTQSFIEEDENTYNIMFKGKFVGAAA
jgi:hypothetical protein